MVDRLSPPERSPHEQHAGQDHAGYEPLLRGWPAPARLLRGEPVALSGVGTAVELRAVEPSHDAGQRRLAVPRRTPQPAPLPRQLAAEPADLRVPRWIPRSTTPKSVTVRNLRNTDFGAERSNPFR